MCHHGRAVLAADIEHQPVTGDAGVQGKWPRMGALAREESLLEQVLDRNRALVLDVGAGTPDRFLVQRHRDDAMVRILLWRRFGHVGLRRSPPERAKASSPSAMPNVIAAGPNAR